MSSCVEGAGLWSRRMRPICTAALAAEGILNAPHTSLVSVEESRSSRCNRSARKPTCNSDRAARSSAPPRTAPSQSPHMQVPLESCASEPPQVRSSGAELNSPHRYRRNRAAPTGDRCTRANLGHSSVVCCRFTHTTQCPADAKRPPGNRAAFSLGRIVPTEAKPSELSGCIVSLAKTGVKAKTLPSQHIDNKYVTRTDNL